jgi:hypothetical protein
MFPVIVAAVLYLVLICKCGRFTAKYASRQGRSKITWFILSSVFYPLPSIVLALLPPHRKEMAV